MLDPNKIKKKVSVNDFIALIRGYKSEQIEDSGHSFDKFSSRQRELVNIEEAKRILLKDRPFLVGIQENQNYAAFYKHQGKNLRMILKVEATKVKIVTFYYILEWQIPRI